MTPFLAPTPYAPSCCFETLCASQFIWGPKIIVGPHGPHHILKLFVVVIFINNLGPCEVPKNRE